MYLRSVSLLFVEKLHHTKLMFKSTPGGFSTYLFLRATPSLECEVE